MDEIRKRISYSKNKNFGRIVLCLGSIPTMFIDDLTELSNLIYTASIDHDLKGLIISSCNTNFCCGVDIDEFGRFEKDKLLQTALSGVFKSLNEFQKPIVFAVQGNVSGLGLTMLFHGDFVFAAKGTQFHAPFVGLGLVPEAGSTRLAPMRQGYLSAMKLFVLGDVIDTDEAISAGIITEAIALEKMPEKIEKIIHILGQRDTELMVLTKSLFKPNLAATSKRIGDELVENQIQLNKKPVRKRLQRLSAIANAQKIKHSQMDVAI